MLDKDYKVRKATSGEMALKSIDANPPDLILLDIMMPGMNGYDVCERLKSWDNTRDIPIIFISALDDTEMKVQAFEMGAADYVTKPFEAQEVLMRVKTQLIISNQRKQLLTYQKNQGNINSRVHSQSLEELTQARKQISVLQWTDPLTKLANRKIFEKYLHKQWQECGEQKTDLSIVMADIDALRAYNLAHGYGAGDEVIKKVGGLLKKSINHPKDLAARFIAGQFILLLPTTDGIEAGHLAHLIRDELAHLQLPHKSSTINSYITMSMGTVSLVPNHNAMALSLLSACDQALEEAKRQGGNCIVKR
ncbi:MAG: diguanylate cyclase [Synechococcaceae cyanobacterium RL_1_2]|nr:diguanylate cyclase [Synechococcaceae cyanobacterium RL_1_2]